MVILNSPHHVDILLPKRLFHGQGWMKKPGEVHDLCIVTPVMSDSDFDPHVSQAKRRIRMRRDETCDLRLRDMYKNYCSYGF